MISELKRYEVSFNDSWLLLYWFNGLSVCSSSFHLYQLLCFINFYWNQQPVLHAPAQQVSTLPKKQTNKQTNMHLHEFEISLQQFGVCSVSREMSWWAVTFTLRSDSGMWDPSRHSWIRKVPHPSQAHRLSCLRSSATPAQRHAAEFQGSHASLCICISRLLINRGREKRSRVILCLILCMMWGNVTLKKKKNLKKKNLIWHVWSALLFSPPPPA